MCHTRTPLQRADQLLYTFTHSTLSDIFGRPALCSSDVNTALLKLSPLHSCIPAAFGNTLKPLSHYFPENSSSYLFVCNRISRNEGGNTAAVGRPLCTTDIHHSESLQVRTPCHDNNQLLGLLALRLPSVRTMKTYCDISQSLNSALETVPICQSNYRPWVTILSAPSACQATPDFTWLET